MWNILVAAGANPSHFYRCYLPLQVLASRGEARIHYAQPQMRMLEQSWDLIIMFESYSAESHEFIMQAKRRRIPVLYDIDDYTFEIPASYGGFELFYERGKGTPTSRLVWLAKNLQVATGVVCSTAALAARLSALNSSICVIENGVDYDGWAAGAGLVRSSDQFIIGWHGSYNHWDDLSVVVEPVSEFLTAEGSARLEVIGMPEIVQRIPADIIGQVRLRPFSGDMTSVRALVRRFDVGLAPAASLVFNECKSDLRVLQYGAASVAVIGSRVPYGRTLSSGRGILADTHDEWLVGLTQFFRSPQLRHECSERLRVYVQKERTSEDAASEWARLIASIVRPPGT